MSSWIQLASGRQFWPLDPKEEDFTIEDIAHGLAAINRYGGHTKVPYSVAQHSIIVSTIVPTMQALLHDASEGLGLVDIPSPVKKSFPNYIEAEERLMQCVAKKFGFDWPMDEMVKQADIIVLVTERRDLMGKPPVPWTDRGVLPLMAEIKPFGFFEAKQAFLDRYEYLVKRGVK